jgi:hypothetical protein
MPQVMPAKLFDLCPSEQRFPVHSLQINRLSSILPQAAYGRSMTTI